MQYLKYSNLKIVIQLCFVILCVLSILRGDIVSAQETEEKSLLGFADYLYEREHYYQAVTEYERFIYFNPHHPSIPRARLKIAFCYKMGEKYDRAIELFRNLVDEYRNQEVGKEAAYQVGECYGAGGNYELALIEFKNFMEDNPHHHLAEKAKWEAVWTHIYLEDYASASSNLLLIEESSPYQQPSRELARALKQLPHLPRKSPLLAGLLSAVIPGGGQFYIGKRKQAIFSLITNALLFYGTYEAFAVELFAAGGVLSFFSLNYYSGNIFGALNGAHKINRAVREEHLGKFRRKYDLSISLRGGKEGALLGLALNF